MNKLPSRPRLFLVVLAALLSIAFLNGAAQQTKPEILPSASLAESNAAPETLQVTSRLVVLDVVVTDKAGALRNDLTKGDFQVTEAGVPQSILNFEPPSAHGVPAGPPINSTAELERQAPQAPVNVIVLDELNTRFEDMAFAQYALKKYLNAQPGQLRVPTMLLAVSLDRMLVLKDYTQDRAAILTSLKKHLIAYPWHLQRGVSRITQLAQSLGALEQVAQATAGHPGHKNLLWVGHGFPGIDLSSPNLDQVSVKGINSAVQQAVNMLRDSRITLYTIDPTALSSTVAITTNDDSGPGGDLVDPGSNPFAGDVNFVALAKATGGKSFFSRNDVDAEIGESARDGVNYYTITYRPTSESDADQPYRKIRIIFTRSGLRAGFRDGYYTRDDAQVTPAAKRSVYDIDSATESTLVYTGLTVKAIAKPDVPGTYLVGVPERELTWTDSGNVESAKLTVVAAEIDPKGKILRRVTNDMTARRQATQSVDRSTGLVRLEIALPSVSGVNRVRFVVRASGDGRIGTADLRIPGAPPDAKPSH